MGKSRSGGEQEQAPAFDPAAEAANMQQSMFGDMMQKQAQNRQAQQMMRMQRQQAMGGMGGLGGLLMGLGGAGDIESYLDQLLQKRMQGMGLMQQQPINPIDLYRMPPEQRNQWISQNSGNFYQGS